MTDNSPRPGEAPRQVGGTAAAGARVVVEAGRIDRSQIGDHNVQISYQIGVGTFADRPGAPPLISVSGDIDSPYRGLRAFEEVDAPFFFGRDQDSEQVLRLLAGRLESPRLLMVSGASGAGKSSLIRAGVLPLLRAQGLTGLRSARTWPCQLLTPSPAPMEELALRVATLAGTDAATCRRSLAEDPAALSMMARQAALAHTAAAPDHDRTAPPPRLLLVVDQFEQLFTRCRDEAQRQAFIAALHAAATRPAGAAGTAAALVVLVIRSDFEARATDYPQLIDAVRERHLLTPMSELELRTAITEPARRAHAEVHTALVDTLMEKISPHTLDTAQDPTDARAPAARGAGLLPLLSHALDNAWRRRADDTLLTLNDYTLTGGLESAVADSAQHAYDLLTPTQQTTARHVFLHLTATDENGNDTAAPTTRNDLLTATGPARAEHVPAVLEAFAGQRLLTLAPDSVEISHEALLNAWPLLRDTWLADTHTDRILRTRLRAATGQWQRNNRDPAYLYRGSLLQAAGETAARIADDPHHHPALTHTEAAFLHASTRASTRATRLRQSFIAALMALVVGLAAVTVFALRAREEASRQRDVAVARQLMAQSGELRDSQPDLSKLKALAAWRIHHSDETRHALLEAAASPGIGPLTGHKGKVSSVAFSSDGTTLASGSYDGAVRLF
ncbi:NACHT and WD repeat domain-containing protein [Streptomyces sp. NPDC059096]|uniref:NACHT and WD repeat domain-containing protein n=1 Tax=Streptomyces sp. NPDC059096 TaxID=3346727 RepID=UPI0036AB493D